MVRILTNDTAEERRPHIEEKPLGRCGTFIMDVPNHSGLYKFIPITTLPDMFYRQKESREVGNLDLLYNNLDAIMERTDYGPMEFVEKLADAP